MAKTEKTKQIELALWREKNIQGTFGCFEVTIGWFGTEIVDFITYKTNGEFRCYEIKVSKADFKSNAKLSFHGDFNYYVMPIELYEELKNEARKDVASIGYYSEKEKDNIFDTRLKNQNIGLITISSRGYLQTQINPKRKCPDLSIRMTLLQSMLRSSNREIEKFYKVPGHGYWE
ncbi:hypothetical protein JZO86_06045 [Enterococcus ureasiticus]|uniref:hypothetical protein n=1 Tax=Enterococcus ureasiticus TaxID=903984 RepID=UPI001A90CBF4|nr:hypothetical protein [Enterococcus ureasiticus]MBO0473261.1 hypothetical protein [Enterococcus ureasiticus]